MNFSNLIKEAWRALTLNKIRAFLTMLGIIIGVSSVITMLAIGEGSRESIGGQISSMGANMINVRPSYSRSGGVKSNTIKQTLTLRDLDIIKKDVSNIAAISPMSTKGGQSIYGPNNWPTTIYGVNSEYLAIRSLTVEKGTMFTQKDYQNLNKVAVIGPTVAENLFQNGEDPLGKLIRFNSIPFTIIGVLESKGESNFGQDQDDVILAPYSTVQKRISGNTYLQGIILSASSEDISEQVVEDIKKVLRTTHKLDENAEDDFDIRSQQELMKIVNNTSNILSILLAAIAGISLFVGGIGIMNIMYVSVKERTKEIGLRMAVGAKAKDILRQFLAESIMISITGGIIGILISLLTNFLINTLANWPTNVTYSSILLSFIVCTITGVFFGWYPAKKAAQLDPINALRYE